MLHVMARRRQVARRHGLQGVRRQPQRDGALLITLFDGKTGALLSIMQADYLGQVRTGAASGVATKYMARPRMPPKSAFSAAASKPARS